MAKCIKMLNTGQSIRVPDKMAEELVDVGRAEYINRETWKKDGRIQVKDERGISRG